MKHTPTVLITLLCLFTQVSAQEQSAKWRFSGIDLYYAADFMQKGTPDYYGLDQAYSNQALPRERLTFDRTTIHRDNPTRFRLNGINADVAFAQPFFHKWLHSQEIRIGASHSGQYSAWNSSEYFGMTEEPQSADTVMKRYLGYSHNERAVNIDLSYLLNFRLAHNFAAYAGATASVSPNQVVIVNYHYETNKHIKDIPSANSYVEDESIALGAKSAFSAGALIGCKLSVDCRWNIFAEGVYKYRWVKFNNSMTFNNPWIGLHIGLRYKFGNDPSGEREENSNSLFW